MTKTEIRTLILIYGIATRTEIDLVTDICGYNEETLNNIIYVRTGYRNIEQYEEHEVDIIDDEDDEPNDIDSDSEFDPHRRWWFNPCTGWWFED